MNVVCDCVRKNCSGVVVVVFMVVVVVVLVVLVESTRNVPPPPPRARSVRGEHYCTCFFLSFVVFVICVYFPGYSSPEVFPPPAF